jgi:hypothetical protein
MTVSDTNGTEARPGSFTVLGRTIPVKPMTALTDGQRLGFVKIFRRCMVDGLDGAGTVKLDQALSKLLAAEDNDWLDYQIMEDRLAWTDVLMELMACLRGTDAPTPAPSAKAPRARKAAAKKAAPAKKAAKRA